jgi:replication factor A1
MKVSELQAKQGNVEITLKIREISEPREFSKFGMVGRVANAVGEDDSGEIKVTLWNEQIESVKAGDTIKITKGYVSEWQGEKQLSTGKFGTLEVVEGGEAPEASEEAPAAMEDVDKAAAKDIEEESSEKEPEAKEEKDYDDSYDAEVEEGVEEERVE